VGTKDGTCSDTGRCRVRQVSPGSGDVALLEVTGASLRKRSRVNTGELCDNLTDPSTSHKSVFYKSRAFDGDRHDVRWLFGGNEWAGWSN
jgi:hypothetical protein